MQTSTCSISNGQHVGSLLKGSTQDLKFPVQLKIKSQHLNPKYPAAFMALAKAVKDK